MLRIKSKVRRFGYLSGRAITFLFRNGVEATIKRCLLEWRRMEARSRQQRVDNLEESELLLLSEVAPQKRGTPGSVAVHAHVFYMDLAGEIADCLARMPYSYDLYISVVDTAAAKHCERLLKNLRHCARLDVRTVENRGRDIAPFVCTFGRELSRYDYVCHIHTKKSDYNAGATTGWREYLYDQLLGSTEQIRRIFAVFTRDESVGLVYPQNFSSLPYTANTWLANHPSALHWTARLGIERIPRGYFDYPAGSMFWARPKALAPLLSGIVQHSDFEEECGQTDGTLAHCLERIIGILPEAKGFRKAILADTSSPSWSSWRMDQYLVRGNYGWRNAIEDRRVEVVAFDIFDTLLLRPLVDPEDTKWIVAAGIKDERFPHLRAEAERLARQRAKRDIGMSEIYSTVAELTRLNGETIRSVRDREERVEMELVRARDEALHMLKHALAASKRVILISDTFLERSSMERMLERTGIVGYAALYLSSEVGLRKDSGELFRYVLKTEQRRPEAVLMIGDNERSDWQIPTDLGMRTYHVMRPVEIARSLPRWRSFVELAESRRSLADRMVAGMLLRKRFEAISVTNASSDTFMSAELREFGYVVAGPILVSFCEWLLRRAQSDGYDELFFLSREGEILKKVFDRIASGRQGAPRSHYLVVSRRAMSVPLVDSFDDIRTISRMSYFGGSIREFLNSRFGIDLPKEELAAICGQHHLSPDQPLSITHGNDSAILPLLRHLAPLILESARAERKALEKYVEQSSLRDAPRAAVVDIGYAGTVQDGLSRLMGRGLGGYYLVSTKVARERAHNRGGQACGYFVDSADPEMCEYAMWQQSFVLEMLLSSDEAQLERYSLVNGTAVPIFVNHEQEEIAARDARRQIRAGAFEFVEEYLALKTKALPGLEVTPDIASRVFEIFVRNISNEELDGLNSLVLDDHYCGRGVVGLKEHLDFMRGASGF